MSGEFSKHNKNIDITTAFPPELSIENNHVRQKSLVDMSNPTEVAKLTAPVDWLADTKFLPFFKVDDAGQTIRETINVDGVEREFYVHLPKNYNPLHPVPMVLTLHGFGWGDGQGGSEHGGKGFEQVSGFSDLADRENFIALYPSGNRDDHFGWNNGQWWFSELDDVKFVGALLDKTSRDFSVDKSRIYAIGYSQGGSFLHRLIAEMPNKFAAAAEVGGWMTGKEEDSAKGLSFLSIQSVLDSTAPPDGRLMGLRMQSEEYTSEHYRRINGISDQPSVSTRSVLHGGEVRELVSKLPEGRGEIKTMWLNNEVEHSWYGGLGDQDATLNATKETWSFVSRFKKAETDIR